MDYNATQANGQLIAVYDLAADKSSDVSITLSGFKLRGTFLQFLLGQFHVCYIMRHH